MSFKGREKRLPVAQWLRLWVPNVRGVDSNAAWSHMLHCGPKKRQRGGASGAWFSKGATTLDPPPHSAGRLGGGVGGGLGNKEQAVFFYWENDFWKGARRPTETLIRVRFCFLIPGTGRGEVSVLPGRREAAMVPWAHGCLIFNFKCFVFRYVEPLCLLNLSKVCSTHKGVCAVISLYGTKGSLWTEHRAAVVQLAGPARENELGRHPGPATPPPPPSRPRVLRAPWVLDA